MFLKINTEKIPSLFFDDKRYTQYMLEISTLISFGYEEIKENTLSCFKGFFCNIWEDGDWKFNDEYFQKFFIKNGKKLGIFDGAKLQMSKMEWLKDGDLERIDYIIKTRNYCTHELYKEMHYSRIINPEVLNDICLIIYRIKHWWLLFESEFILQDHPNMTNEEITSFVENNAKSSTVNSLKDSFFR